MRSTSLALLAALGVTVAAAAPAAAAPFEIYAQVRAGGGDGKGISGDQQAADFWANGQKMSYGAVLGAKLLIVHIWVEHDQYTNFDFDPLTTWTQFMAGVGFDMPLGGGAPGQAPPLALGFGLAIGYGVGTGQQITPPLSNSQLTDQGFMVEGKAKLEYRASDLIRLGVVVPLTFGYMFKTGVPANDPSNQYQSLHLGIYGYLQFTFGIGN